MKTGRLTFIFETAIVLLFLSMIFAPPIKTFFSPHEGHSETEKREFAPFPGIPNDLPSILAFPSQFEAYYNDHFGFRDFFIYRYQREMRQWFSKTGSKLALQGRDNWVFFTGDDLLEDYRGLVPLSDRELSDWVDEQNRKEEWLRQQGIRYVLFVVPNKQSIYPEYLPEYIQASKGTTRFEQVLNYLGGKLPAYMLDLHTVLRASKDNKPYQIYYKIDTHWNMLGAYIGFQHVFDRISQWYPDETFTTEFSFYETLQETEESDLGVMLMMEDRTSEKSLHLKTESACAQDLPLNLQLSRIPPEEQKIPFMKGCPRANLRAVVFRDSFFIALEPFFSENFEQVVYVWKQYDQDNMEELIEAIHPDIVIEERVERLFYLMESIYHIDEADTDH